MKSLKLICTFAAILCGWFGGAQISVVHAETIPSPLKLVDAQGIVSYISPVDGKPYVFFGATDAWIQLRKIGTAVSSEDFVKIPSSDSGMVGDMEIRKRYAGQFIFSLTDSVPLWYVSTRDFKRYYFDGSENSFQFLMKMNTQLFQATPAAPSVPKPVPPSPAVQGLGQKKNIIINLATQELQQREGDQLIATYKVSTGKASTPTPRGTFIISWKHPRAWSRSARLWMPYYMKFNNAGAGIHELPEWPSGKKEGEKDLGRRVSHGCVRLGVGAAKILYDWAPVGTQITIVAR